MSPVKQEVEWRALPEWVKLLEQPRAELPEQVRAELPPAELSTQELREQARARAREPVELSARLRERPMVEALARQLGELEALAFCPPASAPSAVRVSSAQARPPQPEPADSYPSRGQWRPWAKLA